MSSCLFSSQQMSILSPLTALPNVFVYGKSIKTIQEKLEDFNSINRMGSLCQKHVNVCAKNKSEI